MSIHEQAQKHKQFTLIKSNTKYHHTWLSPMAQTNIIAKQLKQQSTMTMLLGD